MPTALLICGFLGVGKTTLARQLEQKIPATRFSHDEWMTRLCGDDRPGEHPGRAQPRNELFFASYRREQTVTSFMFFIRVERRELSAIRPSPLTRCVISS